MEIVFSIVLAVPLEQNRRPRLTPTIFEGAVRPCIRRRHVADAADAITDGQLARLPPLARTLVTRPHRQVRTGDVEDASDASPHGLPPLV